MLFLLLLLYQSYSLCVSPYIIHDEFSNCYVPISGCSCENENTKFPCANLTKIGAGVHDETFDGTGIEYDHCNKNTTMIELQFVNDVVEFSYKNYEFSRDESVIDVVVNIEGSSNIEHECVNAQGNYLVLVLGENIDLYVNGVKRCSIDASQLTSGYIEFGFGTHLDFLVFWDYEFEDAMIHDIMRIRQHEIEKDFEYCFEIVPKCYDIGALEPETCSTHGKCSSLNNCTCCPGYFGNECDFFDEGLICPICKKCECSICNSTECPEPEECPTCNTTTKCPTCNTTEVSIEEFDITKYDINKNLLGVLTWIIIGYLIITFGFGFIITWIVIGYRKLNQ